MRVEKAKDITSGLRIQKTTLPDSSLPTAKNYNNNEEDFLKALQRDSMEAIFIISEKGRVKFCNEAVKSLLKLEPFRLKGKNIRQIIPLQQWVAFKAAIRACEEDSSQNIQIDCQFLDSENKVNDFSIRVKDQRQHPAIEGFSIHAQKINRLKKQEKKLHLRNLVIETVKEGVVIVDPTQQPKVVFVNSAFFDISGFSKSDILGNRINIFKAPYSEMLFTDATLPKEIKRFHTALKENKAYTGRGFSRRKNGEIFYHRLTIKPVLDLNEKLANYVITIKPIQKRKRN